MGPRQLFDALERFATKVASMAPRSGLALAGALGATRNTLSRRWPAPATVGALFGLSSRRAWRVAQAIAALEARNRAWVALAETHAGRLAPLIRWTTAAAALPTPAILGIFHVGAFPALPVALSAAPWPWDGVRSAGGWGGGGGEDAAGPRERGAGALRRLMARIETGARVIVVMDERGSTIGATCLGRTLAVARGPLLLARETGAPLLPLLARWRPGGVDVEWQETGSAGGGMDERSQADALAGWLEGYLRRRPEQLGLALLHQLTAAVERPR